MAHKSRRILILTTAYLPQVGGSELAIKHVTDRLPEFEFDLITSKFSSAVPSHERIGNVNVYRVGNSLSRLSFLLPKNFLPIAVFFKARALISEHGQYRLVHAYQASQAAGGGWLLKWAYPRMPFAVSIQEGKVLQGQSPLTKLFRHLIFNKADRATAISHYLARYIASQSRHLRVEVIPNGVDIEKFSTPDSMFPQKDKTIITVSRLVKKNGVEDLVSAMAVVLKRIPDAKLLIVGDGPLKESLKTKTRSLGLEHNVEFLGEIPNEQLPHYLRKAVVFVRPSLSEGLGTAFLEAMASGVAIIGTPVGGIPDFLKDRETGLFCKVSDPDDIAQKIITLLSDGSLRQHIIDQARELISQKYTWDIIAEQFRNFYGTIANS